MGDEFFGSYIDTSGPEPITYTWEKI